MRKSRVLGLLLGAAALVGAQPTAQAGGFEYPGAGTRALGRGGAFAARADDPMALLYNPANLANLPGIQLALNVNLAFWNACASRTGTYNFYNSTPADDATGVANANRRTIAGYDATPGTRFNADPMTGGQGEFAAIDLSGIQVCNDGPPGVVPELVLSWRVHDRVGIGIGVIAPAAVGHTTWGDTGGRNFGVINHNGQELPSPLRYNLIEENLLIAWPTIGVGVKLHDMVSLGATFGMGFAILDFTNMTTGVWGEQFSLDILTQLHATDSFVPRVGGSLNVTPHDNIDVMAGFTWTQAVKAEGDLDLTTGYYVPGDVNYDPGCTGYAPCGYTIPHVRLNAPQPWSVTAGFRYGDRIRPRGEAPPAGQIDDPMANERWDVELDVVYERNSLVDAFDVSVPNDPATGSMYQVNVGGLLAPVPNTIRLDHNWKDQVSIRVGGDWNIVPNKYAVRLGYSFESMGVENGYQQVDFMPFMRYGLHLGATFRIHRTDLSIGYAHFFQQTQTINDAQARIHQVTAFDALSPANTAAGQPPGTVINAGTYKAHLDVISIAINYHFGATSSQPQSASSEAVATGGDAPPPSVPEPSTQGDDASQGWTPMGSEPDYGANEN